MSRWAEEFSTHAIHDAIEEAMKHLSVVPADADDGHAEEVARIAKVLNLIRDTLQRMDPDLIPGSLLTNINNQIRHQNFTNQLLSYSQNGGLGHLQTANNHIDGAVFPSLQQLSAMTGDPIEIRNEQQLQQILKDFAANAKSQQDDLSEAYSSQSEEIGSLRQKTDQIKSELDSLDAAQNKLIETWTAEFDAQQEAHSNSYEENEAARKAAFEEWFKPTTDAAKAKIVEFNTEFEAELNEMRIDASNKHKKILDLHNLVAGDSVAVGYLNDGKSEKGQADLWRWISVFFIISTVAWLGFAFALSYEGKDPEGGVWVNLARTASLTGVLLFGAAYASRQSKTHRDQERRARWFGLEMKALDPYIDSLEPDQQKVLKAKLADRFFGQRPSDNPVQSVGLDDTTIKSFVDLASKLTRN